MAVTSNQFNASNHPLGDDAAISCYLVTPSDTNYLADASDNPVCSRGISFGTAGTLKVEFVGGLVVTIPDGALAAGVIHPLKVVQVWSTGTTATDIVVYV